MQQNYYRCTIYLDYSGEKMSNDRSTDVHYIQTINRSPGLQYKQ